MTTRADSPKKLKARRAASLRRWRHRNGTSSRYNVRPYVEAVTADYLTGYGRGYRAGRRDKAMRHE